MEQTTTKKGLKVIARINQKKYQIGLRASINDIDPKRILNPTKPKIELYYFAVTVQVI